MQEDIERVDLSYHQVKEEKKPIDSRRLSLRERSIQRMGKYSWIAVLNQLLMGLGLLYLAIWLSRSFMEGWIIVLAVSLFLVGSYYGWHISRQTEIELSDSGAAIFSYAGLWKQFLPMVVLLFLIRMVLIYLDRSGIASMTPFMRTLTFFIAGVFTARGFTLLVKIYDLKKDNNSGNKETIGSEDDENSSTRV